MRIIHPERYSTLELLAIQNDVQQELRRRGREYLQKTTDGDPPPVSRVEWSNTPSGTNVVVGYGLWGQEEVRVEIKKFEKVRNEKP